MVVQTRVLVLLKCLQVLQSQFLRLLQKKKVEKKIRKKIIKNCETKF